MRDKWMEFCFLERRHSNEKVKRAFRKDTNATCCSEAIEILFHSLQGTVDDFVAATNQGIVWAEQNASLGQQTRLGENNVLRLFESVRERLGAWGIGTTSEAINALAGLSGSLNFDCSAHAFWCAIDNLKAAGVDKCSTSFSTLLVNIVIDCQGSFVREDWCRLVCMFTLLLDQLSELATTLRNTTKVLMLAARRVPRAYFYIPGLLCRLVELFVQHHDLPETLYAMEMGLRVLRSDPKDFANPLFTVRLTAFLADDLSFEGTILPLFKALGQLAGEEGFCFENFVAMGAGPLLLNKIEVALRFGSTRLKAVSLWLLSESVVGGLSLWASAAASAIDWALQAVQLSFDDMNVRRFFFFFIENLLNETTYVRSQSQSEALLEVCLRAVEEVGEELCTVLNLFCLLLSEGKGEREKTRIFLRRGNWKELFKRVSVQTEGEANDLCEDILELLN